MSKLFFIGDSVTLGAWDEQGGWASRLTGKIMNKTMQANFCRGSFYCLPYNLGISGNTAEDLLVRIEREIYDRVNEDEDPNEAIQFVFAIGINDSIFLVNEKRPRFSDDTFKRNIQSIIKKSQNIAQRISFIGLTPVQDELLDPIPWAQDKSYANCYVERYEMMISEICDEAKIPFLPLYERWLSTPNWRDLQLDGVHPNSKGHELLAQQIGDFIFTDDFFRFHTEK
jgi:lysophospholipase L1-like esterase